MSKNIGNCLAEGRGKGKGGGDLVGHCFSYETLQLSHGPIYSLSTPPPPHTPRPAPELFSYLCSRVCARLLLPRQRTVPCSAPFAFSVECATARTGAPRRSIASISASRASVLAPALSGLPSAPGSSQPTLLLRRTSPVQWHKLISHRRAGCRARVEAPHASPGRAIPAPGAISPRLTGTLHTPRRPPPCRWQTRRSGRRPSRRSPRCATAA